MGHRSVTIMFALPEFFIVLKNFSLGPIRPCEATDHRHLVLAIYSHGIMSGGVCQSVAPDAFAAVQISPRVAGNVLAVNPQVHVELVGVGWAGAEVGAADDGFAVGTVEEVDSPMREGCFSYPRFDYGL